MFTAGLFRADGFAQCRQAQCIEPVHVHRPYSYSLRRRPHPRMCWVDYHMRYDHCIVTYWLTFSFVA